MLLDEMLLNVFSFIKDPKTLGRMALVSKKYKHLSEQNHLWRRLGSPTKKAFAANIGNVSRFFAKNDSLLSIALLGNANSHKLEIMGGESNKDVDTNLFWVGDHQISVHNLNKENDPAFDLTKALRTNITHFSSKPRTSIVLACVTQKAEIDFYQKIAEQNPQIMLLFVIHEKQSNLFNTDLSNMVILKSTDTTGSFTQKIIQKMNELYGDLVKLKPSKKPSCMIQ